ncbi:hypothetical protein D2V17_10190 [Aurantiacibacter xanthus]|uniref:Uncharacterized protein n=1 Tax=Aurantiacibacter xanthus TaxID=1784712 RepID=A0A3A1P5Y5_9SPHN|nr:hypothetical protein D2V17_10190 [Aurantiacibacter xanthus]
MATAQADHDDSFIALDDFFASPVRPWSDLMRDDIAKIDVAPLPSGRGWGWGLDASVEPPSQPFPKGKGFSPL